MPRTTARALGVAALTAAITGLIAIPAAASPSPGTASGGAASSATPSSANAQAKHAALARLRSHAPASVRTTVRANTAIVRESRALAADDTDPPTADPTPPPTTVPTLTVTGTSDVVTLSAQSQAPYVLFERGGAAVDGQSTPTPVATVDGAVTASLTTYGLANDTYSVTAQDCASADVISCSDTADTESLVLDNAAPTITAPLESATVTGGFTVKVNAPVGAGVQFAVDGVRKGFDGTSPFSFAWTGSALSAGSHVIQVTECSASGLLCSGPVAAVDITSNSLHPKITAASPTTFSPNGDRYRDTTAVSYSLPDKESATIAVTSASGAVVRTAGLGTRSGKGTWTWNGRTNANKVVGSGRYKVTLSTSATRSGAVVKGAAWVYVTVDLHAPSLTALHYGTSVYPVKDGYKDTFPVSFHTNETTAASLVIVGAHNKVVRTITAVRVAGAMTLSWSGYDSHAHLVAAGTYSWHLTWHDGAGNKAHSVTRHVSVSHRHLVTKTKTIVKNGDAYASAGGSDPSCADASTGYSDYPHGVWLANVCDYDYDGPQIAAAFYHVALPAAVTYSSIRVDARGYSLFPPTYMYVGYGKNGGSSTFHFGNEVEIGNSTEKYWHLSTANPTGLMTASHVMNVGIAVEDDDSDACDFDIASVRFTVTYKVLN